METILSDIQRWYAAQCDDDWEHSFGVTIQTLDNPGWSVRIDLEGTLLEEKSFEQVTKNETDQSWLICRVAERKFTGYGDPGRLEEILSIFLQWAKSGSNWLSVNYASAQEEDHKF